MAKTIVFNIQLNGQEKIISNSKQLKDALAEIRKELEKTQFGTDAYQKLTQEQAKLLNVSGRLQASTRQTRNELKASGQDASVARGSYEQLSAQLSTLSARWRAMGAAARDSFEGQQLERQIAGVTRELSQLDARVGKFQRNVGNYQSAFGQISGQIGTFIAGGFLVSGFQSLVNGLERLGGTIIRTNAQISDSLADVQRVAKLTDVEANQLLETLKGFDTRTTLDELLKFAAIGGRLGVPRKELAGFTKALDDLNVALGGELGSNVEEVATQLGKLDTIFKVDGDTAGERLTKIGNAIVDLANKGTASGQFLTDFSQRLAGISSIAGLTLGQTLGLGAGFEELGQSSEVAGTAVTQLILKIGTDVPKYARLAGKSAKEFGETLNNDPVEALIQLSEGLTNNKDGLAEMSVAFADAEARGVRVGATLGVIGKNADFFREKIVDGTAALKETSEITDAVAIKQDTLGAAIKRVGNNILESFINSGFADWLKDILLGINDFVKALTSGEKATTGLGRGLQVISNAISAVWSVQQRLTKAFGDFILLLLEKAGPAASFIATKFSQLYNVSVDIANQFREIAGLKPFEKIDIAGLQKDIELYTASIKKARQEENAGGSGGSPDQRTESRQAAFLRRAAEQRKATQLAQEELEKFNKTLGDTDKKSEFAAGSIGRLKEEISKLTEELEKTTSPANFAKLTGELLEKQEELRIAESNFNRAARESLGFSDKDLDELPERIKNSVAKIRDIIVQGLDDITDDSKAKDDLIIENTLKAIGLTEEARTEAEKRIQKQAAENLDKAFEVELQKKKEKFDEELKLELDLQKKLQDIRDDANEMLGEQLGLLFTGQQESFKEFIKNVFIAQLDAAKAAIQAQILASEIAKKGFLGLATGPVLVGVVEGIFAGAKAFLSGFEQGGFTGKGIGIRDQSGEPVAGVVHANEYVIPKKVLQSQQGQELARQSEVLRRMYGYRTTPRKGFAEGGFTSISTPSPATQAIIVKANLIMPPEVERTIERAVARGSAVGAKVGSKEGFTEGARTVEQSQTLKDRTGF